jgi:hypothetical protein
LVTASEPLPLAARDVRGGRGRKPASVGWPRRPERRRRPPDRRLGAGSNRHFDPLDDGFQRGTDPLCQSAPPAELAGSDGRSLGRHPGGGDLWNGPDPAAAPRDEHPAGFRRGLVDPRKQLVQGRSRLRPRRASSIGRTSWRSTTSATGARSWSRIPTSEPPPASPTRAASSSEHG